MSAKFHFYRNLRTGTFSLRVRGKVIGHPVSILCSDCTLVVSENGRKKVIRDKRKNVHAYISAEHYIDITQPIDVSSYQEVYYNPYTTKTFVMKTSSEPIVNSPIVLLHENRVYIPNIILN